MQFVEMYKHFSQDMFIFKIGLKIGLHLVNDLVADCVPDADEEYILKSLVTGTKYSCSKKNLLPCMEGHNKCYNISEICSYKLNLMNYLLSCGGGQHLEENCNKFECIMMYKCSGYYCIPW